MPPLAALIWAGAAGAAIAVVGAVAIYWAHPGVLRTSPAPVVVSEPAHPAAQATSSPSAGSATPGSTAPPPESVRPAFDVVSVEPTGEAVVAGRAAPNVTVALLDGGRPLAETTTNAEGQFVLIPAPLPPGDHSLTLTTGAGGLAETSNPVPVSVAPPPAAAAVASATPSATPPVPAAAGRVAIQSIEASAAGGMVAKGAAAANATVRLYVSGVFVGDARTSDDGRWSLTIEHGLTPGAYAVRADEIDPTTARVLARAEAPVAVPAAPPAPERPESAAPAPTPRPAPSPSDVVVGAVQTHHVERGNTLWGISQRFFGDGSRYAVIFSANSAQIRDPNLIYPGQTFLITKGESKP